MLIKILNKLRSILYCIKYFFKINSKKVHMIGKFKINGKKIENDENVVFYDNVKITNNGTLKIGRNVKIGDNTIIYCSNYIEIGDNTIIAANSYIIDCNHQINKNELIMNQPLDKGKVIIGKDCWLGEDVSVIKGAKIEDGVVIGAKALVNSNIPAYKVAVGIPAKIIGERK